jgi:RND family efflux transporter MFP subunit
LKRLVRPIAVGATAFFCSAIPAITAAPAYAAEKLQDREFDCVIEPHVTAKLGAAVPGLISSIAVDRGDVVKAGQVVAKLESGVEEANLALARGRAENNLQVASNKARAEFLLRKAVRQETLRARNVVAESTLDEAQTDAAMAESSTKESELNLRIAQLEVAHQEELLNQRTIRSPIDGLVVERALSAGEYVHDTNNIMTIAQIDPLNVEVFLPAIFYGQANVGDEAEVMPEAPVGGHYKATTVVVDHVLDASSGTFGVRLELPNHDYHVPGGMRCKVLFSYRVADASSVDLTKTVSAAPATITKLALEPQGSTQAEPSLLLKEGGILTAQQPTEKVGDERGSATQDGPVRSASRQASELGQAAEVRGPAVAELITSSASLSPSTTEQTSIAPSPIPLRPATEAPPNGSVKVPSALVRELQVQLKRVGCDPGAVSGEWSAASRLALKRFNRHAGTNLSQAELSPVDVELVRAKSGRVCPLVCAPGLVVSGKKCVVACKPTNGADGDQTCSPPSDPNRAGQTKKRELEATVRSGAKSSAILRQVPQVPATP